MNLKIWLGQIDWDATGAMLSGWGALGSVFAIIYAASATFKAWKQQKLAERKRDHAERILTAVYRAKAALGYIRGNMIWSQECYAALEKLERGYAPDDWIKLGELKQGRLVTAQALLNRLNQHVSEIDELDACLPMAEALFEKVEIESAIRRLSKQFRIVESSIHSFRERYGQIDQFDEGDLIRIGQKSTQSGERDEVSDAIKKAVKDIKDKCLPALRLEPDEIDTSDTSVKLIWPFGAIRRRKSEK